MDDWRIGLSARRVEQDLVAGMASADLIHGRPKARNENPANRPATPKPPPEERIAVTVRLPKDIAHALIDASAERRKNRDEAWSQQDIVAQALEHWFDSR